MLKGHKFYKIMIFKKSKELETVVQLVVFDFDGTLSEYEMIDMLGERMGCKELIEEITEESMRGDIEYIKSLRSRVKLLAGLSENDMHEVYSQVVLRQGAGDILKDLRKNGLKIAIVTGGFIGGVECALKEYRNNVDWIISNELVVENGHLTGEVKGEFIEETKGYILKNICKMSKISFEDVVVVGDGSNDIPMLEIAGLAIGFKAKEIAKSYCDHTVDTMIELSEKFRENGIIK
jgi:phosphoserine phosphatase